MSYKLTPEQRDEVNDLLERIEEDAGEVLFELVAQRDALPKVKIVCETRNDGVIGSAYLNTIRVERHDDGSLIAVTDHWPFLK